MNSLFHYILKRKVGNRKRIFINNRKSKRKTDDIITKRKVAKRQTMVDKTLTENLRNRNPTKTGTPLKQPTKTGTPLKQTTKTGTPLKQPTKTGTPPKQPTKTGTPLKQPTKTGTPPKPRVKSDTQER